MMAMLLRTLLLIALIGGIILLVQYGADEPGRVLMNWYGYQIDTSATVVVALVNSALIFAFFGGRMFGWVMDIPLRIRNRRQHRQDQRALALLALGLEAQTAGDDKALAKLSNQLNKALPAPKGPKGTISSHPLAARLTAQFNPSTEHLHTLLSSKETAFTGHVGLLNKAQMRKDWTAMSFHAAAALKARPASPSIVFTLMEAQLHSGQYAAAQETVKKVKDTHPEGLFYYAAVNSIAARDGAKDNPAAALKTAQTVLKIAPQFVPAALFLAAAQQQLGKATVAERTLADFFTACPRYDVFQKWWALVKVNNPTLSADKLTKKVENILEAVQVLDVDATKDLCRATALLDIGELHPAQDAAEAAFQLSPSREILMILANVEDRLGHLEAASGWRAEALQASTLTQLGDELMAQYQSFLSTYTIRMQGKESAAVTTAAPLQLG